MGTCFEVTVGNIGYVGGHNSLTQAYALYNEYKRQSEGNYGRASGEDVALWETGVNDPIATYVGTGSIPESSQNLSCFI